MIRNYHKKKKIFNLKKIFSFCEIGIKAPLTVNNFHGKGLQP